MARYELQALLVKNEGTYGTDAVPTGAANALIAQSIDWTPLEHDEVARPRVRAYYGNDPVAVMGKRVSATIETDLAASGTLATAPRWGSMMAASGMAEVINAGTSVVYLPQTNNTNSCSIYHYMDGTLHKSLGSRGTWSLTFAKGAIPKLTFGMMGLYGAASAAAIPAQTFGAQADAPPVGFTDTTLAQLDGYDVKLASLTYAHGVQVAFRDLPNSRSIVQNGWQSTAEVTFEAPDGLAKDFLALIGQNKALSIQHGATAGNIIRFDLYNATLLRPRYSEVDGVAHLTLTLRPLPNTGNDQCAVTLT